MDVTIKKIEPKKVAYLRHVGPYDQSEKVWGTICSTLHNQGYLGPNAEFIGVCHDDPEKTPAAEIRYDACVTVDDHFKPEGDIKVKQLDMGECAIITHKGPYSGLMNTYQNLFGAWLPESGREYRPGPCFETYLNNPQNTDPEDLLTEVHVPLK